MHLNRNGISFIPEQFALQNNLNFKELQSHLHENILGKKQLQMLAHSAQLIEEPQILGEFKNDAHYVEILQFVLASTLETTHRLEFFNNEVLSRVHTKQNFLDIGPGNGLLTQTIAPHFNSITVVDINQAALDSVEKLLPKNSKINKIKKGVADVQLSDSIYDLAVLSHCLYYINSELWLNVVEKIYRSLRPNGLLVIVLGGDEGGKAELIKYFGGNTIYTELLARRCIELFGDENVDLFVSSESFFASSLQAMLLISAFMLADAKITALRDDLIQYILLYFKQTNYFFEMTTKQKYILIHKKAHISREARYETEAAAV